MIVVSQRNADHESGDDDAEIETVAWLEQKTTFRNHLREALDRRNNLQWKLWKVMDILRSDMPSILGIRKQALDRSIYHQDIAMVDPSGIRLSGVDKYVGSIHFLQQFVTFWFQPQPPQQPQPPPENAAHRCQWACDAPRLSVRVSWEVSVAPRLLPFAKKMPKPPLRVSGVFVYRLDPASGRIAEHGLQGLSIYESRLVPPYGVLSLLDAKKCPKRAAGAIAPTAEARRDGTIPACTA